MEQRWKEHKEDGYVLIVNERGETLGLAEGSRVGLLNVDGFAFKDFLGTGELAPYEDWRLSYEERAKDLSERISIEDIAGLPVQLPADMGTVERQKEDVPFDMECYQDEEGHVYEFGFGMNYDGVIKDGRTRRYTV